MKVLQVIDKLAVGGAERVAVDMTMLLSKEKNISVAFLCLLESSVLDEELLKENIPIIYLRRKNKYNPFTLFKLLRILNTYDIVHVHSRHILRYIGLTFFPLFRRKFKLVFHDHFGAIDTDKAISNYLKFCIKKSSAYIGVSQSLIDWITENKLNKNSYLLSNIVRKQTKTKTLTTNSSIVVVGNFRPQKNYEFLCELISKLPNSIRIDVYGNCVDETYYNKILKLKDELAIKERVQIIIGEKNTTQLLSNYKLALHCASSETGPLVAIEYLSQGIPVLMYKTGEVAATISRYSTALLMSDFDTIKWKSKIEWVLSNESERLQLASLGTTIYNKNYSEEKYSQTCQNIYQNIINS